MATFDDEIRAETEEALALTGRDVGTPILHFRPPGGTAFFGPVISRLPSQDEAVELWDHVIGLAGFPRLVRSSAAFASDRSLRALAWMPNRLVLKRTGTVAVVAEKHRALCPRAGSATRSSLYCC